MGGVGDDSMRAARRSRARRRGLPLGLVIGRYFVYVLLCALVPAGLATAALIMSINYGALYPANYGVNSLDRISEELAAQPSFDASAIPSAYWYAHLLSTGEVLATDMSEAQLTRAAAAMREAVGSGSTGSDTAPLANPTPISTSGPGGLALVGSYTYAAVTLGDGSWCVLACDLVPQFTTRELRDSLPDPQSLYFTAMALSFVVPLVVFAIRASRVITRKMSPLLAVAGRVSRRDLDFEVGTSNVRQINDVLAAMERMRAGLKGSLERQWEAERRQRDQVAALAHDLKTPLTVVRANVELLAEEGSALSDEDRACADDIARAARQLDDYVGLLIEASRTTAAADLASGEVRLVPAADFARDIIREARSLAIASHVAFSCATGADVLPGTLRIDGAAIRRAVMNVVANAVDHGRPGGVVRLGFAVADARLVIAVDDDGPGFSPAALARGTERFFREDPARTSADLPMAAPGVFGTPGGPFAPCPPEPATSGRVPMPHPNEPGELPTAYRHLGLGLAIAADALHAAGSTLTLSNRMAPNGTISGARVTLVLPLA